MAGTTVMGVSMNNNEALSGEFNINSFTMAGIKVPVGWAGGAVITFQTKTGMYSKAGQNPVAEDWSDVYDDTGTEVSLTAASNRFVGIGTQTKALALLGAKHLRIRSGTGASPVNQNLAGPLLILLKDP